MVLQRRPEVERAAPEVRSWERGGDLQRFPRGTSRQGQEREGAWGSRRQGYGGRQAVDVPAGGAQHMEEDGRVRNWGWELARPTGAESQRVKLHVTLVQYRVDCRLVHATASLSLQPKCCQTRLANLDTRNTIYERRFGVSEHRCFP